MTRLPELPQVFQRAWRSQAPKSPSRPHLRPSQPRGITPGRPIRVKRPPGAPPARSARRSPRGGRGAAFTSPGAGCGPGCRLQAGRRRTLRPSPRRQPRQPWLRPLSFSSTISSGKRKRKPLRGGPGPERAASAERGPAARGGGPRGCAWPAGRRAGWNPVPPRGRAAGGRARAPLSVGAASLSVLHSAPARASWLAEARPRLLVPLHGFLSEEVGAGLVAGNKPLRGPGWGR